MLQKISNNIIILFLFIFILLLNIVLAAECGGNIPCDCGDVVISDYNMSANLSCSGNGLIVGSDNILLDCQGYTISHTGSGAGILVEGGRNVTIKNCNIIGDKSSNNFGIYFYSTSVSYIINTTTTSNFRGILLHTSNYNTLSGITSSNEYNSIYLTVNSNFNTLSNITSSNNDHGIALSICSFNTLSNIISSNNTGNGILIDFGSFNSIYNTTSFNNEVGIRIYRSPYTNLTNTTMYNNTLNLEVEADEDLYIDTSNLVDGKPVYWIKNENNKIYDSSTNAGLFACFYCNNITIKDMVFTHNMYGLIFKGTSNSIVSNLAMSNNGYGLFVYDSSNNTFSNITTTNNENYGIYVESSSYNTFSSIISSNNSGGIQLVYSSNNTFFNVTTASNEDFGIYIESDSSYNILSNIFSCNNYIGIYLRENSNFNTLSNITSSNNGYGIRIESSNENVFFNITSLNNYDDGISLDNSNNNFLYNIISNDNNNGICLYYSNDNFLSNITSLNNHDDGICIKDDSFGNIFSNVISSINTYGINFQNSAYNSFFNITISESSECGIYSCSTSNNNFTDTNISANINYICMNENENNIMINTSFSSSYGSVRYSDGIQLPDHTQLIITAQHLNISFNSIFLDTSDPAVNDLLNRPAQLTLTGLNKTVHIPVWDPEDDGTFVDCPDTICTIVSDSGGVFVYNVTGFSTYSSREGAVVDITPPSIQILSPSNNTWHKTDVMISFVVIDDISTTLTCTFYDNGINVSTLSVNNNIITNITPSLTNAKHDIYFNCSDEAGNSNISDIITIYFDNLEPSITNFIISPTTVYVGETITYNCSASDNSESYGGSVTTTVTGIDTSSAGTKTATCIAIDTAGNNATATMIYYVSAMPALPPPRRPVCTPDWQCSPWSDCLPNGTSVRTCIDVNNCNITEGKPSETMSCVYICIPDWQCTEWTPCTPENVQTRSCIDAKGCPVPSIPAPATKQSCFYISEELKEATAEDAATVNDIQNSMTSVLQAIDEGDYDRASIAFDDVMRSIDYLLSSSPSEANLRLTHTIINTSFELSNTLLERNESSRAAHFISSISSFIPLAAKVNISYANSLSKRILNVSTSFIDKNRLDELLESLSNYIRALKDTFSSQLELIDELLTNNLDPDALLKLDILKTSTKQMRNAYLKLDDAENLISEAKLTLDIEKKRKMIAQAIAIINESGIQFPEINKVFAFSVEQRSDNMSFNAIKENVPREKKEYVESFRECIPLGAVDVRKAVFSYRLSNIEFTEVETYATIVKLEVTSPIELENFTIMEYIPKWQNITIEDINSTIDFAVLNADPVIAFNIGTLTAGERRQVVYVINKKLDEYHSFAFACGTLKIAGPPTVPPYGLYEFPPETTAVRAVVAVIVILLLLAEAYLSAKIPKIEFTLFKTKMEGKQ
ncbi:MAG: NosD domain-containing protein [Candidatus Aenigmatarchaeota archaeon]